MVDVRKDGPDHMGLITYYDADTRRGTSKHSGADTCNWHREGGLPAFISEDVLVYYRQDKGHRINGPFQTYRRNSKDNLEQQWALYGTLVDAKKYFAWIDKMGIDINNITEEDEVLIAIEWNT